MTALDAVLAEIAGRADCARLPARGQPAVPEELALPDDLATFYRRCGGACLFTDLAMPVRVCMPIVATSVAETLQWLLATDDGDFDTAFERHPPLGDAFDD